MAGSEGRNRYAVAAVLMLAVLIMSGCGGRTRYVLVTDRNEVDFDNGSLRFICLQPDEAAKVTGLLTLYKDRDVQRYGESGKAGQDPIERVLYPMLRKDYGAARVQLEQNWTSLPDGLRLLLRADLSYENGKTVTAEQLTLLYQDAYEHQPCDVNRDLIRLRIRQLRYGR